MVLSLFFPFWESIFDEAITFGRPDVFLHDPFNFRQMSAVGFELEVDFDGDVAV